MVLLFYGTILAGALLYANTLNAFQKTKDGEIPTFNYFAGCILSAFILFPVLKIISKYAVNRLQYFNV